MLQAAGWEEPAEKLDDTSLASEAMLTEIKNYLFGSSEQGQNFIDWEARIIETAKKKKKCIARKAKWPNAAPFALFLSHDIDQIHDRELFRWLGDINHLRRHWFKGERGNTLQCLKRIIRPGLFPINPLRQFKEIRRIEDKHNWCSTFFLLEDEYWRKKGGRFKWDDPEFCKISDFLLNEDCELGIHGSAYRHDDPEWWKMTQDRFNRLYGHPAVGTRVHHLKMRLPQTWHSQRQAGLHYDTTFGLPNVLGAPGGFCFPFEIPLDHAADKKPFVELPLSIMDQTLFRYLRLDSDAAFAESRKLLETIIEAGGLAVLLWHNNFFAEAEYREWQETYERLLDWLAPQRPWTACGKDIADWWRRRNGVQLIKTSEKSWCIKSNKKIKNLVVDVFGTTNNNSITCSKPEQVISIKKATSIQLFISELTPGSSIEFSVASQLN